MNRKQFITYFRAEVLPVIAARYEQDGIPDRPARREAWNDLTDAEGKDWIMPTSLETVRVCPCASAL